MQVVHANLDGLLTSFSDIAGFMIRIVELASDPEVLACNFSLLVNIGKRVADLVFITISCGTVDVPA